MKKLFLLGLILSLIAASGATTVESETVTVDLESYEVDVEVELDDMNSDTFSYTTSYTVNDDVEAVINGEQRDCSVENLQLGSVIRCPVEQQGNLTADLKFTTDDIVDTRNSVNIFQFRKTFSTLTDQFQLNVVLPAGTGIVDQNNVSTPTVIPENYEIGSTGRRITVTWNVEPDLGESIEFQLMFEELREDIFGYERYMLFGAVAVTAILIALYTLRRLNRDDIESIYEDLSDDEIDLLETIRDNEGEILQKDIVDKSDYSKAKISEIVSSLEEKEVIVKEKDGRSNKIKIDGRFRY